MRSWAQRTPVDTGPLEVRDFGSNGGRLGTLADCYDGSPWELHRGELVEQMGSKDLHGIAMAIVAALFRAHARPNHVVMTDVYCDLSDSEGLSFRAPDVTLVKDLVPQNRIYTGTPVLAVEVRGTQSKKYLEEKVQLFLEHDWPLVWIIHVERGEIEVRGASTPVVIYREGDLVPLPPALGAHGLEAVPAECLYESEVAVRYVSDLLVDEGKKLGLDEGKKLGLDEGKKLALIANIQDICELLDIPLDNARLRDLSSLDVGALDALRVRLKRDRSW